MKCCILCKQKPVFIPLMSLCLPMEKFMYSLIITTCTSSYICKQTENAKMKIIEQILFFCYLLNKLHIFHAL